MKKILSLVLLALCLIPCGLRAEGIPAEQLVRLGVTAYQQRSYSTTDPVVKRTDFFVENGDTLLAVLSFQNGGFIVMSADDACAPVLAYSTENDIDVSDLAPGAKYWLDLYQRNVAAAKKQNLTATPQIAEQWRELSTKSGLDRSVVVAPLLTELWNQSKYYNDLCPEDADSPLGYGGHVPCGCVALAMAMVIHYYRYPATGQGQHGYMSNYGVHSVNYGQQTYNYDAMPYVVSRKCHEAAKLIYHCGIAVDMNYAAEGSGAQTEDTRNGLVNYYKYASEAETVNRTSWGGWWGGGNSYSTEEWIELLKGDIDLARPIIYSGYDEEGGHAFVCDGYDSDNLFHFNFGWGGYGNGYFTVEEDAATAIGGYNQGQTIVHKIHPPTNVYPEYCSSRTITNTNGSLEDGSGNSNYPNNANCTYIISPVDVDYILISIQQIETQENHDLLKIWDGNPNNGGVLVETFSGNTCNPSSWYRCDSGSAYITFTSDGNTTGAGWRLIYTVRRNVRCNSSTSLTAPSGHIEDGSGDEQYASDATCYWNIKPTNATYVNLHFTDFNLSPEDYVKVYDGLDMSTANLLGTFTDNNLPSNLTSNTGIMKVEFISDNYIQLDGFAADYTSNGVEDTDAIEDLVDNDVEFDVFPNPASAKIRLNIPAAFRNGTLTITDMAGRTIRTSKVSEIYNTEIPIHDLADGIYLISIHNNQQMAFKKLIVR